MTEKDLEIARQLGASSFLVFNVLKLYPRSSVRDLVLNSGLNETTVRTAVKKLEETKIVKHNLTQIGSNYAKEFTLNENWELH